MKTLIGLCSILLFSFLIIFNFNKTDIKNENINNYSDNLSSFLNKYNFKLESVKYNLTKFLESQALDETNNFFQQLEVSDDKMHFIQLPDSLNNKIFSPLKDDTDILECRVFLFSQKFLIFSLRNFDDHLNCINSIYEKNIQDVLDGEVENYLGVFS